MGCLVVPESGSSESGRNECWRPLEKEYSKKNVFQALKHQTQEAVPQSLKPKAEYRGRFGGMVYYT